jgi:hypothetical protein
MRDANRLLSILLMGSYLLVVSEASQAQEPPPEVRYIYSAKFVCGNTFSGGNSTGGTLMAGSYKTDINIQRAAIAGKASISILPTEAASMRASGPGPVGSVYTVELVGSDARKISCFDIAGLIDDTSLALNFRVGFVQIFSTEQLSVVGVYAVKACNALRRAPYLGSVVCEGEVSLDVERYLPVLVEPVDGGGGDPF